MFSTKMMIVRRSSIFALLFTCVECCIRPAPSVGNFTFASYYGDHMVLQRGPKQAIIWGYGPSPGSDVTVSLSGETPISVKVDKGNTWKVKLAAVTDTKPHTITAMSSSGTIMLSDVLFGDVWICSGQSNMVFIMRHLFNATEEIADAVNYPDIRIFTVGMEFSSVPLSDLRSVMETWSLPNKETVGGDGFFSAVCFLYGKRLYNKLKYPIGLVTSAWGGTPIETWSDTTALKKCNIPTFDNENSENNVLWVPTAPSLLWNAMMFPLTNMTIYGALWYQGEANAIFPANPNTYNCTFPAMISSWRETFHVNSEMQTDEQFPFGFVQLGPWKNDSSITTGFPDLRWHQTVDYGYVPNAKMNNVFMATAMDLPDFSSPYGGIHPRDKQDVADRLLLSGLSVAYGINAGKYQGPFPTKYFMDIQSKTYLITYDDDSAEIDVRSADGFEVCCSEIKTFDCSTEDSTWVSAPVTDHDKQTVSISYEGCASSYVVAIRYAWRESPCPFKKCAVYSIENNLPAPPFIQHLAQPSDTLLYHSGNVVIPELIKH
ncbi:sialate O-acetylesterase-like [Mytilus galloprovincialis]|uniref:sialate O-acetylesterase-like n=1 Tax=Mytilus galloprovincialis TaxID=29158 RepID=UPI003F7CA9DB